MAVDDEFAAVLDMGLTDSSFYLFDFDAALELILAVLEFVIIFLEGSIIALECIVLAFNSFIAFLRSVKLLSRAV